MEYTIRTKQLSGYDVQQSCVRCNGLKEVNITGICRECLPPEILEQFTKCLTCGISKDIDGPYLCKDCIGNQKNIIWSFRYRAYKKQRTIQLKPTHDKTNHFSIIWTKNKKSITDDDFTLIDIGIRNFITSHNNKLIFRVIKACKNCTYGRFDDEFENLILSYRNKYNLHEGKDLPLDDPRHQHLKNTEIWDENHPIIFHIHSRSQTGNKEIDDEWYKFMQSAQNSTLTLNIEFERTE